MIQSPILAFEQPSSSLSVSSTDLSSVPKRFDLVTASADLLYTWGPGFLIRPKCDIQTGTMTNIASLLIGGGVILPQHTSVSSEEIFLHWHSILPPSGVNVEENPTWNPHVKVVIAGGTDVNNNCRNDLKLQWPVFAESLENLGAHAGYWKLTEIQAGLAVNGQIFAGGQLQYNRTWAWQEGNTWKQNFPGMMSLDIPFEELERPWGLQVSYCTGIARRVPLRILLADIMPVFVKTISVATHWQVLVDRQIIEAFKSSDLTQWLNDLSLLPNSEELVALVKRVVLYVLLILKDTGIDRTGKLFRIACIEDPTSDRPIFMCIQVSCEKDNLWARILADSKDCATFAYMTRSCLESDDNKCQSNSPWHCASLDTAVCRYRAQNDPPTLQSSPWQLRDRALYWIGRPESGLQARVRKLPNDLHPKLYVSISAMSEKTLARLGTLKLLSKIGKRTDHIREKQYDHMEGEGVLIFTELKS